MWFLMDSSPVSMEFFSSLRPWLCQSEREHASIMFPNLPALFRVSLILPAVQDDACDEQKPRTTTK